MSRMFFHQCLKHGDEFMIGMKRDMLDSTKHQEKCPLCKAEARITELEKEDKRLRGISTRLTARNTELGAAIDEVKYYMKRSMHIMETAKQALKGDE